VHYLSLCLFPCFLFRLYSILRAENVFALPSGTSNADSTALPTATQPVSSTNDANKVPLAVGLTIGILALIIFVLGGSYYLRRRWRTSVDLDAHPFSLQILPPMTQAGEQSGGRQYRKQLPQPTRPPRVPVATGSSTIFSDVAELGPPPSYA
jgi:hypothetical protein